MGEFFTSAGHSDGEDRASFSGLCMGREARALRGIESDRESERKREREREREGERERERSRRGDRQLKDREKEIGGCKLREWHNSR